MSNYSIALFLHVVGALGFFVVLGLEWIGMSQLRRARLSEEARAILGMVKSADRLGFISMPTTIVTGIYMLLTVWGWVPWILVVLGALVLEIVLFVVLARPRMAAIEQALATEKGFVSHTFHDLVNHPILWISIRTRVAIILGIVRSAPFQMRTKLDPGAQKLRAGAPVLTDTDRAPATARAAR